MDLPSSTLKLMRSFMHLFLFIFPTPISLLQSFLAPLCPLPLWRILLYFTKSCIHTTLTPSTSCCANTASLKAILSFPSICASASLLAICLPFPRLLLCPRILPSSPIPTPFLIISLKNSSWVGSQAHSLRKSLRGFCTAPFNPPLSSSLFSRNNQVYPIS